MRKATLKKVQYTTMYLPGFEPDDYVPMATNIVAPTQLFQRTAAHLPTELAVASAVVANSAVPLQVLETCHAIDTLSINDEEFDVGEMPGIEKREWSAFALDALMPPSGEIERVEANIRILKLVKSLREKGENPTLEQSHEILRYTGWGSISRIFADGLEGKKLEKQQKELRSVLDEKEWASARASTPNAHYTDPGIISAVWGMVEKMGFKGGKIIEPAAGTGLFLAGIPGHIAANSQISAVELDTVSGGLLNQVFAPRGVKVHVCGLEEAKMPKGFYDLAIGNIPFGNYRVPDTSKSAYADWSIHNWFFGRALDLVRPGGLVVFITSSYTMEAKESIRKWLNVQAELVHAVRLPEGAFQRQAKTDVVTDIIVLRKRMAPRFGEDALWTQELIDAPETMMAPGQQLTRYASYGARGEYVIPRPINPWYAAHPSRVIGKLVLKTDRFGKNQATPMFEGADQELHAHLRDLLLMVRSDVYKTEATPVVAGDVSLKKLMPLDEVRPGQFVMHGDKLCVSEGDAWIDVDVLYKGKLRDRVIGMMGLRDAARAVLDYQRMHHDDDGLAAVQKVLNERYDQFVAKNGYLFDKMNLRAFRSDPDCPLVFSLEMYDEDTQSGVKADIFTRRTVNHRELPKKADNPKDALLISMGETGHVSLPLMAKLLRWKQAAVAKALVEQKLAFKDPVTGDWMEADEYLSGHIRNKLAAAGEAGKGYEANVAALQEVLPKPLGPGEIHVRLGAPWIPTSVVEQFIIDTMALSKDRDGKYPVGVQYEATGSVWSLVSSMNLEWVGSRDLREVKWGTQYRSFFELITAGLNQQPPTVTYTVDGKVVVNKTRTLEAREKYEAIKDRFKAWAYEDESRTELLVTTYNSMFNQIVPRKWNGSHLVLHGLSDAYVAYQHQLNAIWRILVSGNTLLAHVVGAGKSLTMMSASMELRRLGKAVKPVHAVPNHMLLQYTAEFLRAYPNAKVLMADKESLTGDKRREFAARVATGDWDAVIMTHASFERLPMRPETTKRFVQEMLDKARLALSLANDTGAKRSIKELEKRLKTLEAKLKDQMADSKKDGLVYFEDLGIDYVFCDEMHLFKNLMRISKMPRIAGLPNSASQRAFDLLIKSNVLSSMLGGKEEGLVGATATPIANSIAEMHVMQRFIQPNTLAELGLDEFDAWAATFGEAVTGMEIAPDGSGYRMNTRFAKFVNVAELMAIFRMRADIQTRSMLNLPTPAIAGGKPRAIACAASDALKAFTKSLVERADKVRNRSVKPEEDNMLKITHAGRIAALDMRLVDPSLPAHPGGKLDMVCREVVRIHAETAAKRGTQLIFCDMSTPKEVGFSVYNQLRCDLIAAGIPAEQIEFIHDHDSDSAKDRLFRRVREGSVRVLMGSTSKMGVGTNVQLRLKAVHQIDSPWRPCDVEQRDGRGLRVGNMWEEIELLRYVTESSFDSYMWQGLEIKAAFIEQIMCGDTTLRSVEDVALSSLTFAEIKAIASGNPLVLEKATVDGEVLKLTTLRDLWEHDRYHGRQMLKDTRQQLEFIEGLKTKFPLDAAQAAKAVESGFAFTAAAGSMEKAAAEGTGQCERIALATRKASGQSVTMGDLRIGSIGAFELNLRREWQNKYVEVVLPHTGMTRKLYPAVSHLEQTGKAIMDCIHAVVGLVEEQGQRAGELREREGRLAAGAAEEFEHAERLKQLRMKQASINAALDLDKDEAGAAVIDESNVSKTAEAVEQS